ncbi:hypothetical protein ACQY0O_007918 [Thecaphora frezii]
MTHANSDGSTPARCQDPDRPRWAQQDMCPSLSVYPCPWSSPSPGLLPFRRHKATRVRRANCPPRRPQAGKSAHTSDGLLHCRGHTFAPVLDERAGGSRQRYNAFDADPTSTSAKPALSRPCLSACVLALPRPPQPNAPSLCRLRRRRGSGASNTHVARSARGTGAIFGEAKLSLSWACVCRCSSSRSESHHPFSLPPAPLARSSSPSATSHSRLNSANCDSSGRQTKQGAPIRAEPLLPDRVSAPIRTTHHTMSSPEAAGGHASPSAEDSTPATSSTRRASSLTAISNPSDTDNSSGLKEKVSGQADATTQSVTSSASHRHNPSGKHELRMHDPGVYAKLGYSFPWYKKWWIITVIFWIQLSMNFNTGVYANGVPAFAEHFGISEQAARVGQAVFLIAYAFGSELWAPWSEELGRKPIMQASLMLVNIWQLPCALAPNYGSVVVGRVLGGLSSAGGSVTIGMVADLWEPEDQAYAVLYVVFSSVAGSSIGPLIGPFSEAYLSWRWIFWLQLIFGGFVQLLHMLTVPETRSSILIDREAKRRREEEGQDVWGPNELKEKRFTVRGVCTTWYRPFYMLATEPIVLACSLLSGFSDALIFTGMEGFQLVYKQWGFQAPLTATIFVPIWIGYILAALSYIYPIEREKRMRRRQGDLDPETHLWWLLFLAPLEGIGLFGFAWTSQGPPTSHWIAPMIFSVLIAMANLAIYNSTIAYLVISYGAYSASATGGNAFARNGLAGIATMYSTPLFQNLGYQWAASLLGFLAFAVTAPIFLFYWRGDRIRAKSRFASSLAEDRKSQGGGRMEKAHHLPDDSEA